jgi:MFS family permease
MGKLLNYIKASKHDSAPDAIYNWRLYAAGVCAASAAVMIGYDSAFFGTSLALASFKREFNLSPPAYSATRFGNMSASACRRSPTQVPTLTNITSVADIVSVYQAGAFFGSLGGYPTAFFAGRRWGMLLSAIICFAGSAIMLAARTSTGLAPIFAGRAIAGVGIGMASSMAPLYISEIAPPQIRGQLIGMYEIAWQVGGIVGFWINYGM